MSFRNLCPCLSLRAIVFAAIVSVNAHAELKAGGMDGCGGNGPRIRPELVDRTVELLPDILPKLTTRIEVLYWATKAKAGEEVTVSDEVMQAWFQSEQSSPLADELRSNRVLFISSDSCSENGRITDASYRAGVICFNRKRLANGSTSEMVRKVISLSYHELAHHFGFGETLAEAVQKDLALAKDVIDPSRLVLWSMSLAVLKVSDTLALVRQHLNDPTDTSICFALGKLESDIGQFVTSVPTFPAFGLERLATLSNAVEVATGYCGLKEPTGWMSGPEPMLALGDRAGLISKIATASDTFETMASTLRAYLTAKTRREDVNPREEPFVLEVFLQDHGLSVLEPDDDYSPDDTREP